jgi:hypothetical protein
MRPHDAKNGRIRKDVEEEHEEPHDSPSPRAYIIVIGISSGERHRAASKWHRENRLQPIRFNGIRATRDTDGSVVLRLQVIISATDIRLVRASDTEQHADGIAK